MSLEDFLGINMSLQVSFAAVLDEASSDTMRGLLRSARNDGGE